MVKLNNIKFINFRNFINYKISFNKKLNIFFGANGCGKTNILEGISLIDKGRGIRNSNISNLIKRNEDKFLIESNVDIKNNNFDIEISSENQNGKFKKIVKVNDDLSKDSLDVLNKSISYLIFIPEMERLFQASPSYRRNFLDRLIYSSKNNYNRLINKYKKSLVERIKILHSSNVDNEWLNQIETEICSLGLEIYNLRSAQIVFINNNIEFLKKEHNFKFNVELKLRDNFFNNETNLDKYLLSLRNSRSIDKQYGGTKIGPHRSDLIAIINNDFEASLLSTGQQKTVVLMILLSQCNYLINYIDVSPILLFDEIGSHLDTNNRQILLDMIDKFEMQFFLTGTNKDLFSFVSTKAQFYNISET